MRVLYVNPFSQQISGPDESLLALLPPLRDQGVEPVIVLPRPGPYVERYTSAGATVRYAPISILRRRLGPSEAAAYLPRLLRGASAIRGIARAERIDLVHTNMEVVLDGAIAARTMGLPHVLHYRGNANDRPRLVFDALTRAWTGLSDRVLCISGATAEIFRSRGLGGKVEVRYDSIPLGRFQGAERLDAVRASLGASPGEKLVGMVARVHPRKDVETFLRAGALLAARMDRIRLAVVGGAEAPEEVEYHERMRQLASELGIASRVCWAGVRRDVPEVMQALDLFMLCSRHEGFGIVVAEAMATGAPVLLTREGAFPELVGHRDDLLAPACDPDGFAVRAARILQAGARAWPGKYEGCEPVSSFDPATAARHVVRVYEAARQAGP